MSSGFLFFGEWLVFVCLFSLTLLSFSLSAEGFTGQGSDAHFSKSKNIFKYRVSPIISGLVYLAYSTFYLPLSSRPSYPHLTHYILAYYVIRTMFLDPAERTSSSTSTTKTRFPDSWAHAGAGGIFGLAVLGLAFLIATLIQFAVAFTGSFKMDLYMNRMRNKWVRWTGELFSAFPSVVSCHVLIMFSPRSLCIGPRWILCPRSRLPPCLHHVVPIGCKPQQGTWR